MIQCFFRKLWDFGMWFTYAVLGSKHFLTHLYFLLLQFSFAYFRSFSLTSESRASAS